MEFWGTVGTVLHRICTDIFQYAFSQSYLYLHDFIKYKCSEPTMYENKLLLFKAEAKDTKFVLPALFTTNVHFVTLNVTLTIKV